jgi:murein DD-endopeptidase MepM/ murein hydrolase activator NlpD
VKARHLTSFSFLMGVEMSIEKTVMPRVVYAARDSSLPRWQFVVILTNRSRSQWSLAECRLDAMCDGPALKVPTHQVEMNDSAIVQGSAHLAPGSACVIAIRDPYPPNVTPANVRVEFVLTGPSGETLRDSLSVSLVPRQTLPLEFPLEGRWTAANARGDLHGIGQAFAFDFVAEEDWSIHQSGTRRQMQPHEFASFGRPLMSPADGIVVAAESGQPDLPCSPTGPPTLEGGVTPGYARTQLCGNHVLIQTVDGDCVLMAHMKQGSLAVSRRDKVVAGQGLGCVGNSGNTTGAHLHIEVLDALPDLHHIGSMKFRQSGVPFGFRNVLRADGSGSGAEAVVPQKGEVLERETPGA